MVAQTDNTANYRAFISYSHSDESWARWLHRKLESFRPGKDLSQDTRHSRLRPVFRDKDELPSSSDLGSLIDEALARAENLIVICSKRSAQSQWVNQEICRFKQLGKGDRIFCLIVDGEPHATTSPHVEDTEECFCEALKFTVNSAGELSQEPAEPLAADARHGRDTRSDALLRVIAGLLGVGFDTLKQRQRARRQRLMAITVGISISLMAIMTTLAVWAMISQQEANQQRTAAELNLGEAIRQKGFADDNAKDAREQRDVAQGRLAQYYINQGTKLEVENDPYGALLCFAQAMNLDPKRRKDQRQWLRIAASLGDWIVPDAVSAHDSPIRSMVISPDEQFIATLDDRGTLKVSHASTGAEIWKRIVDPNSTAVAFTTDGKQVAVNGPISQQKVEAKDTWRSKIELISVESNELVESIEYDNPDHYRRVSSIHFSSDAKTLAVIFNSDRLGILDRQAGNQAIASFEFREYINQPLYASQTDRLAFEVEGQVVLISLADGKEIARLGQGVVAHTFCREGKRLIVGQKDGTVIAYGTAKGKVIDGLTWKTKYEIKSLACSSNGEHVAIGQADVSGGWISVYSTEHQNIRHRWTKAWSDTPHILSFLEDDSTLAIGSREEIQFASVDGKELKGELRHRGFVDQIIPLDGRRLVTRGRIEPMSFWWDAPVGLVKTKELHKVGDITKAQLSGDGKRFISESWRKSLQFTDVRSSTPPKTMLDEHLGIQTASFSEDSQRVAIVGTDSILRVFDTDTRKQLGPPIRSEERISAIKFLSGGNRLVFSDWDDHAHVYDIASGRLLFPPLKHTTQAGPVTYGQLRAVLVSETTKSIITIDDHSFRIFDLDTGNAKTLTIDKGLLDQQAAAGLDAVHGVLSQDGRRLLAVNDKRARVWDAATGEPVSPLIEAELRFRIGALSADGETAVLIDRKAARLVNVSDGKERARIKGDFVQAVFADAAPRALLVVSNFSQKNGLHVVSTSDGTIIRHMPYNFATTNHPSRLHFSPKGDQIRILHSLAGVDEFDVSTGKGVRRPYREGGGSWPTSIDLQFSPNGQYAIWTSKSALAQVWNVETGQVVMGTPIGYGRATENIITNANGTLMLAKGRSETKDGYKPNYALWQTDDGATHPLTSALLRSGVWSDAAAFHQQSSALALTSGDQISLFDLQKSNLERQIKVSDDALLKAKALSFSPDGNTLVQAMQNDSLMFVRLDPVHVGVPIKLPGQFSQWHWREDGKTLVIQLLDKRIVIVDAEGNKVEKTLNDWQNNFTGLFVGPRGITAMVPISNDQIRLIDLVSEKFLSPPIKASGVTSVAINQDATMALVTGMPNTLIDLATGVPIATFRFDNTRWVGISQNNETVFLATRDTRDGHVVFHDLHASALPMEDLFFLAELYSGRTIDHTESLVPLPPNSLQQGLEAYHVRQAN